MITIQTLNNGESGATHRGKINDNFTALNSGKVETSITVNGQALSSNVTITKTDLSLGNVDNTSDANKPVSTATQTALNAKQGTITLTTTGSSGAATLVGDTLNIPEYTSSGLVGDMTKAVYDPTNINASAFSQDNMLDGTTNKNYTATEQTKLAGIEDGAEVNNISDVNATDLTDGGVTSLHTHNTSLDDLVDVAIVLPATQGQSLIFDGTNRVNGNPTPVVGSASTLYLDPTATIADNLYLNTAPASFPQTTKTVTADADISGGVTFLERFVSGPLGRTDIPAGTWTFNTYASTSNNTGVDTIQVRVNKRVEQAGMTGTWTGTGATRTFTVTGGTPFVPGDATGSNLTATLIETPTQTGWIASYISSSQVTVNITDIGYVNESNVNLNALYYILFNSGETIDITGTTPVLYNKTSIQPMYTVNPTDRIVTAYFAKTTSGTARTISLYYGGTTAYSNVITPITTNHSDLGGLENDDHLQYHTDERGDARYNTKSEITTLLSGKADDSTVVHLTGAETLTNKRVTKRVVTTTQSATPAINTDNGDVFNITGLAQAITSFTTNLTGTPVDGDLMMINITDNGTARSLSFGASFEASTIALPTTTVISTLLKVGFQYNGATSKWRCIAVC